MFELPFDFKYDNLPLKSDGYCTAVGTYRRDELR